MEHHRFFAQLAPLRLACPVCGYLIQPRIGTQGKGKSGRKGGTYNPVSSRLRCPRCATAFLLGLIAWPVRNGPAAGQPADQRPSLGEAQAIRDQLKGIYPGRQYRRGPDDPVNRYVAEGCQCEGPAGMEGCRVHGQGAESEVETKAKGPAEVYPELSEAEWAEVEEDRGETE